MRAAGDFVARLESKGELARTARVRAELYGSLALTGLGHGTDRAILLGLSGEKPDTIAPELSEPMLKVIRASKELRLAGKHGIPFEESRDLLFERDKTLPAHPNGMKFYAFDATGAGIDSQAYYSIWRRFYTAGR